MNPKATGQFRQSQVVTTYGPGALIDLPRHSAIVGGLNFWLGEKEEIIEPRLSLKLRGLAGNQPPRLFAPPVYPEGVWDAGKKARGIRVWVFPEWFVVQEPISEETDQRKRRLVHRSYLENGKFEKLPVVPIRFVRACPRGHVDDIDWIRFVHSDPNTTCQKQLRLEEHGTTGDLSELIVSCECGKNRHLYEATELDKNPLGTCAGARPWLGNNAKEDCTQPSRLLVRTATNAYFPQVITVLSLPRPSSEVEDTVKTHWDVLQAVSDVGELTVIRKIARVGEALHPFTDEEVMKAIEKVRSGGGGDDGRHLKETELEALLSVPEGYSEDVPIDPDFHARRLPEGVWRRTELTDGIQAVVQLHRLREVVALLGFTRFEAVTRDIHGEYDTDVEPAALDLDPTWFPAVENRGEGIFIHLRKEAIAEWLQRPTVQERLNQLERGHARWATLQKRPKHQFPGGPYVLLHTLSHLLIQSLAMNCGYPASSIRERIYVEGGEFGLLLYTGAPDAEGTLGGLVQQARDIEDHLTVALRTAELCSNDPICAQHDPDSPMEERFLHGAACHGCALISETSCEMHNDYLDRALVVPVLDQEGATFFALPKW